MTARGYLLEITCADGGSQRNGPLLIAALDHHRELAPLRPAAGGWAPRGMTVRQVAEHWQAAREAGAWWAPCRCPERGHLIDPRKAREQAEWGGGKPRHARRVDVVHVAPDSGLVR